MRFRITLILSSFGTGASHRAATVLRLRTAICFYRARTYASVFRKLHRGTVVAMLPAAQRRGRSHQFLHRRSRTPAPVEKYGRYLVNGLEAHVVELASYVQHSLLSYT